MFGRRLAFVFICFALGCSNASAAPSPPASVASPEPCASAEPVGPDDLLSTFAYDLESPPILRFLAALTSVPERRQKFVFDTAVAAQATSLEQGLEDSVSALCPSLDETYGASRAAYLVVNYWTLRELADAKRFQTFNTVVATALAALQTSNPLSAAQRDAALLPFATVEDLTPPPPRAPSPAASGTCRQPSAAVRALHLVQPNYPPLAVSAGTSGTVGIRVALSEEGYVRSAALFRDTLYQSIGADQIKRASVFAAAATTYAPEIRDCVPVRGAYLFRAEYRRS